MDLDDVDEPIQAPLKASRFAPKSKFQPKSKQPKSEPPKPDLSPAQESASSVPIIVKKEDESQPLSSSVMDVDRDAEPSAMDGAVLPKQEEETREVLESNDDATEVNEVVEEEDYVVAEYDLYFNPSEADTKSFLLQYPLRPSWRPYELDQRCTEVRWKPKSEELEIDLSIDTDSDNYNRDAPAAAKMKKLTLSGTCVPSTPGVGYGIGILKDKKIFLNPIDEVLQLRPSLECLDSCSKKTNIPEVVVKAEGSTSAGSVGQSKKQVQVQGKEMDEEAAEEWIPLKYHGSTSELSQNCLRRMTEEHHNPLQFNMNPLDYLHSLCPPTAVNKTKSKGPSKRLLLSLPLEERLKKWLIEGPPIQRFCGIKHLAPDEPDEDVLEVLQKYAILVQGLWVGKSAIRYPNAIESEALARSAVLFLFSRSHVIKDSELKTLEISEIFKSLIKKVLREIAVERSICKDWKFKEPTDMSFIKLYPDVVKQQEKQWQDCEKQIMEKFPLRAKCATKAVNIGKPGSTTISNEGRVKATSGGRSSRMSMSKETQEALPKVLRKLFQTHKVCSFQMICQGLRDMAVSMSTQPKADARAVVAAALSVDAPQEELQAAISEVAEYVKGVYVLKSSTDHPEFNPLRSLVIELFRGAPTANLKKSEIYEAAKIKLQREPTLNEYKKVMNEYGVSKGAAWVLKSGDGVP